MAELSLFGFQAGEQGFFSYGIDDPIDSLFLRAMGGRGGGKTRGGAMRSVNYMRTFPGCEGMVTSPTYGTADDTTEPALKAVMAEFGFKAGTHYECGEKPHPWIQLWNGSKVGLRSTDKPESLAGPSVDFIWMDEPRLSPFKAYTEVEPTLRGGKGPNQMWFTTTPAGRRFWLRQLFMPEEYATEFGDDVYERRYGHYRTYHALTIDNPYPLANPKDPLPLDELEILTRRVRAIILANELPELTEREFDNLGGGIKIYLRGVISHGGPKSLLTRQDYFGEEVMMEGLVLPDWNAEYHIKPESEWPIRHPRRIVAGIDSGFVNPFVILVEGIDGEGRKYLIDEYVKTGLTEPEKVNVAQQWHKKYNIDYMFPDPEDASLFRALALAGLPVHRPKKNKEASIARCTATLNLRVGGKQGFFVSPKCKHFRREVESWVLDDVRLNRDPSEWPKAGGHDCIDAFRYADEGIERLWGKQTTAPVKIHTLHPVFV